MAFVGSRITRRVGVDTPKTCKNPSCRRIFTPAHGTFGQFCSVACAGQYKMYYAAGPGIASIVESVSPDMVNNAVAHGPAILSADWHIPNLHLAMFSRLMECQKRTGIKSLDIAGDWMDNRAFSPHPGDKGGKYTHPLKLAKEILRTLAKRFTSIRLAPGNHDKWLANFFEGTMNHDDLMYMMFSEFIQRGVLTIVSTPYLQREDHGEHFIIVHQKTFSGVNPQGVPIDLEAHRPLFRDKHVLTTHGHLEVVGRSAPGHRICAQLGCMTDPNRTAYIQEYTTRHREWNPGFGVIAQGWWWPVNNIMGRKAFEGTCRAIGSAK